MGVDALTILLSLGALAVLLIFVGRVVRLAVKLALVVVSAWFLYAKVLPLVKERLDAPKAPGRNTAERTLEVAD